MMFDTELSFLLNNFVGRSPYVDTFIVFGASYLPWLMVAGVLALGFAKIRNIKVRHLFFTTTLVSSATALGITEAIQYVYRRPRPFLAYPSLHTLFTDTQWSFPSAHAAFFYAFSTAVFLRNKKWGSVCFVLTTFMAACRVAAGVHYPSDIVGGMVLGVVTAYIATSVTRRVLT